MNRTTDPLPAKRITLADIDDYCALSGDNPLSVLDEAWSNFRTAKDLGETRPNPHVVVV